MKTIMVFVLAFILLFGVGFIAAQQGDGNGDDIEDDSSDNESGQDDSEDSLEDDETDLEDNETDMEDDDEDETEVEIEVEIESGKKYRSGEQEVEFEKENGKVKFKFHGSEADAENLNITSNGTHLKVHLSNGRNAEIKIMPDTASERALERLRLKVCNETRNCTIQLKEVGQGDETKLAYEIQIERHSRILGIFQSKMQVRAEIDAENGEVLMVGKPWWAFLATEPEEETPEVPETGNETELENETETGEECVVDTDCPVSNCPSEANSTCIEERCAVPACINVSEEQ